MVGLEDRQFLSRDIDPAHAAGARLHLACEIAGIDMQTLCNAEVPTTDSSRAMAGSWPCPRRQTVVIYIAPTSLAIICKQLIAHGLSPDWPAAVVASGTLATLPALSNAVAREGLESPCLTIVGEVVRLGDQPAWFNGAGAAEAAIPGTRPLQTLET